MPRLWAAILLLMVAPSWEEVDFNRIVMEITAYTNALWKRSREHDKHNISSDIDDILLENIDKKHEWKFGFPRYKEAYRYLTDAPGKAFVDKVISSFYLNARGDSLEDGLKQSISHDYQNLTERQQKVISERASVNVNAFLSGEQSEASLNEIVTAITGYTEEFMNKYINANNAPSRSELDFHIPRYKEAYMFLSDEGRDFVDTALICYYLGKRGIFSEAKLKQTIFKKFRELTMLERDFFYDRIFWDTRHFLNGSPYNGTLTMIVTDVTGYTEEFLEKYGPDFDKPQSGSQVGPSRYKEAYENLSDRQGKPFIDEVLKCFYFGSHKIFSEQKLEQSIYRLFRAMTKLDPDEILHRTSADTGRFLNGLFSGASLFEIVQEITGYEKGILEEYGKGYSASEVDNLQLKPQRPQMGLRPDYSEDAYKGLNDKQGKRFIKILLSRFPLSYREVYSENKLKRSIVLSFEKLDNCDRLVILKRVSEEVKWFLLDNAPTLGGSHVV